MELTASTFVLCPWLLTQTSRSRGSVIAGTRTDSQLSPRLPPRSYFNGPIATVLPSICGHIGDGVLITNVLRDLLGDWQNVVQPVWKKRSTSSFLCEPPQHTRVPIRIGHIKDSNGIDQCIRLICHHHDLRQGMFAGIVGTIAYHNQHFLIAISLCEVIEACGNRIVESRHAIRGNPRECNLQLANIV